MARLRNQGWRTWFVAFPIVLFVFGAGPAAAQAAYNMTITSGATSNMSCTGSAPLVCSATASGANLDVTDLENDLNTGSVSINTGSGGTDLGLIDVESSIAASGSGNSLTFDPVAGGSVILSGDVTTGGSQTYAGGVSVHTNLTLTGAGVTFDSTVDGPSQLSIDAAGSTVTFDGRVGYGQALGTLAINAGNVVLDNSIATNGSQTYDGPVTVNTNLTLAAAGVTFDSTVDAGIGPYSLYVEAGGSTVTFDGAVGSVAPLNQLEIFPAGAIQLDGGSVSTVADQDYAGAVTLGTDTQLSTTDGGTAIAFDSTLDGAHSLTVSETGPSSQLQFYGDVGGSVPLASLSSEEGSGGDTQIGINATLGPQIITTGAQTYSSKVDLSAPSSTFSSPGAIDFQDAVAGSASLVKAGSGTLTFAENNTSTLSSGTITVDDGLVEFVDGGLGSDSVEIDGGGLQWAVGNTQDISGQLSGIGSAGATFDTDGNNVTLANAISGAGSVTKDGTGTLGLAGNNNYTGATTVDGGTLLVKGAIAGNVNVEPSAALNCQGGTLNGIVSSNGGTLSGSPATPTAVTAALSGDSALVSYTPGAANCYPVTYHITESNGTQTSVSGTSATLGGLPVGVAQTFTVTAANPVGTSAASASSNAVTVPNPTPVVTTPPAVVTSPTPVVTAPTKVVVRTIKTKASGTLTVVLRLPSGGTTVISETVWGKRLVRVTKRTKGARSLTLTLAIPKKDLAKFKRSHPKPKARIAIRFTSSGHTSSSVTRSVRL